jgi:hypothetical protein
MRHKTEILVPEILCQRKKKITHRGRCAVDSPSSKISKVKITGPKGHEIKTAVIHKKMLARRNTVWIILADACFQRRCSFCHTLSADVIPSSQIPVAELI